MLMDRQHIVVTDSRSLEAALLTEGPRTLEFAPELDRQRLRVDIKVNGDQFSDLRFDNRGGPAVALYGRTKFEDVHDVEWRNHWHAEARGTNGDGLSFNSCSDVHISNISVWHCDDEQVQFFADCSGVVLEESLIHSAMSNGTHSEGVHPYGVQITGSAEGNFDGYPDDITMRSCLIALCTRRMPQCAGDADMNGGEIDIVIGS